MKPSKRQQIEHKHFTAMVEVYEYLAGQELSEGDNHVFKWLLPRGLQNLTYNEEERTLLFNAISHIQAMLHAEIGDNDPDNLIGTLQRATAMEELRIALCEDRSERETF